jgi:glycerophosphoryl diester phosphodiesterase
MKTYLQYDGLTVLAHRGGADESFENTLESFDYSKSLGCKFIETDVQVSADGIPYIFHDDDLKRVLNISSRFDSLSSQEIDKLKIFDQYKIPKLEEALNEFPDISFQIDFKTDEVVAPALDVIKKTKSFERICVASFNSERLKRVRSTYPDLCISMGPNEVIKTLISSFGLYKGAIDGDCLQIPIRYYGVRVVTKRFVKYLKSKGLKIMVWTINDVKTFEYLIELKVDGIITDKPKLLFETLSKY